MWFMIDYVERSHHLCLSNFLYYLTSQEIIIPLIYLALSFLLEKSFEGPVFWDQFVIFKNFFNTQGQKILQEY